MVNEFRKTPEGKIVMYGIHEHGNATSNISANIALLKRLLNEEVLDKDMFLERLEKITTNLKKCEESIDYIYENIKKLQKKD